MNSTSRLTSSLTHIVSRQLAVFLVLSGPGGLIRAPRANRILAALVNGFRATPFFARIAEVSLREIDAGLIEAAQAIGCRRWHIVRHVLLPEALPGIVGGFTITLVSMIGASAMAGAVGAGGLGDMAIRYGYQRFDTTVMAVVIAVLIALVCLVQFAGDTAVRRLRAR
jgi:D-methionine transport system permease protein